MKPLLATACSLALLLLCSSFTTAPRLPLGPHELLTITGEFDGSDTFTFAPGGVKWEHLHWDEPRFMVFAGMPWQDLRKAPALWSKYSGLDLARASIVTRKGRDVVALEHTDNGFILVFADSPDGAGAYSVTIAIPKKK